MKVTVLGCGTSSGVPVIGCDCAVCRSTDPRNRRRRVSVLVESGDTRLLIDTPPDLHAQLVDAEVAHLDAVLYTHGHADHVHGIDDLRSINFHTGRELDAYGSAATLAAIKGALCLRVRAHGDARMGQAEPQSGPGRRPVRGRRRRSDAVPAGARAQPHHRLPDRRHGVLDRREGAAGGGLRRARGRQALGRRLPGLPRASRRMRISTSRWSGSRGCGRRLRC